MKVHKSLPAIQQCVDKLEDHGFKFFLSHKKKELRQTSGKISSHLTYVTITQPPKDLYALGSAYCSREDTFSRARGTQLAFDRAMHSLSRQLSRKQVKAYLTES